MAEQSLKEFYDSLIGASTNWHKIEHNWRDVACVFAFAVSGLYTFSGAVAGSFGHNILWLVIGSVTDPHGADPRHVRADGGDLPADALRGDLHQAGL